MARPKTEKELIQLPPSIRIDPNVWTYKDYLKFLKLCRVNLVLAYGKAQEIIVSWSYPVDPKEPDAMANLNVEDAGEVLKTIKQTLEAFFAGQDLSEVKVDFRRAGWNTFRISEFFRADAENDYETIEEMVHEAVTMDDLVEGETMSLLVGASAVAAIKARHFKLTSGK